MSVNSKIEFKSPIALLIERFIQEKRTCGYKYNEVPRILECLDNFLCCTKLNQIALPEHLALQWLERKSGEQTSTHQRRVVVVRQLAQMMVRLGYPAYIVPGCFGTSRSYTFSPYIFTREEIGKLIRAADQIKPSPHSPIRQLIIPEIIRLLYACGFRLSEVLNLRVGDVDLKEGVITIRDDKFNKDRLVPPALDIVERLKVYNERLKK
ncbi:MAG: tyrosine-type recombinase/integrase [Pseudomonadota bacterium]